MAFDVNNDQSMQVKLVLSGPNRGRTMTVRAGTQMSVTFKNGELVLSGSRSNVVGIMTYLGRCHQAYPEGSEQHRRLEDQHRSRALEYKTLCQEYGETPAKMSDGSPDPYSEHAMMLRQLQRNNRSPFNGQRALQEAAQQGSAAAVHSHIQQDGRGVGGQPNPDDGGESTPSGGGDTGVPAGGSQQQGATPSESEQAQDSVKAAVAQLDPKNDDHWTRDGRPTVEAISSLAGRNVTRHEIEHAAPELRRPT